MSIVHQKNARARRHGRHEPLGSIDAGGAWGLLYCPLNGIGICRLDCQHGGKSLSRHPFCYRPHPHRGSPFLDDRILRKEAVIRIYDILFDYNVLLDTDEFFRVLLEAPEFQMTMSTAEFHFKLGKYITERERLLRRPYRSILGTAYRCAVPVYTSAPGDSSLGMNVAETALYGNRCQFDVIADVNETASIVLEAKQTNGRSGVLVFGGGSPKNFLLQTEPQIQEVLKIDEKGHDFFIQFTDARPDTGGLSGATPSEAVSWGKIDPDRLSHTMVSYIDSTVAMPILTSYALARRKNRKLKRLYEKP